MNLSPNFTAEELDFDLAISPAHRSNLQTLALLLERVRYLGGNAPLLVTSGYRPGDTRQHGTGSAADLRVPNRDPIAFVSRVAPLLSSKEFGQIIAYPHTTRHVHIALPNGTSRGAILVETGRGAYTPWIPGTPVPAWGSGGGQSSDAPPTEGAATVEGLMMLLGLVAFLFFLLG